MDNLEKVKKFFEDDRFATETAEISICDAGENTAVCRFIPVKKHLNAAGVCMGGAIYTLADFCFAVAANYSDIISESGTVTQTVNSDISYLSAAKEGIELIAEAKCIKRGWTTCCYEISVSEKESEKIIAIAVINGIIISRK